MRGSEMHYAQNCAKLCLISGAYDYSILSLFSRQGEVARYCESGCNEENDQSNRAGTLARAGMADGAGGAGALRR